MTSSRMLLVEKLRDCMITRHRQVNPLTQPHDKEQNWKARDGNYHDAQRILRQTGKCRQKRSCLIHITDAQCCDVHDRANE